MLAPFIRCARIHPAPSIIRSSKPAATMRSTRPSRKSTGKEQAIANTTGLRVLAAVSAAVPVRLMKRDLLFVIERLVGTLDENRVEMLARQHGIRQKRDDGGVAKTFASFLRRADEGTLSRLLVESTIMLAASHANSASVLRDAASAYKVDTEAIALKVKQEFATKGLTSLHNRFIRGVHSLVLNWSALAEYGGDGLGNCQNEYEWR